MLAVGWGVEHFHLYVHGVITDHKPLIDNFKNPVQANVPENRQVESSTDALV